MEIKHSPIAKAEMLIRRQVTEVFEAFVQSRDHVEVLVKQRQR
jgi:hypothetical protein